MDKISKTTPYVEKNPAFSLLSLWPKERCCWFSFPSEPSPLLHLLSNTSTHFVSISVSDSRLCQGLGIHDCLVLLFVLHMSDWTCLSMSRWCLNMTSSNSSWNYEKVLAVQNRQYSLPWSFFNFSYKYILYFMYCSSLSFKKDFPKYTKKKVTNKS